MVNAVCGALFIQYNITYTRTHLNDSVTGTFFLCAAFFKKLREDEILLKL